MKGDIPDDLLKVSKKATEQSNAKKQMLFILTVSKCQSKLHSPDKCYLSNIEIPLKCEA